MTPYAELDSGDAGVVMFATTPGEVEGEQPR